MPLEKQHLSQRPVLEGKRSGFDSSTTPPTAVATPRSTIATAPKLTAAAKGKQPAKATKAKSLFALSEPVGLGTDEGTGSKLGVLDVSSDDSKEEISWNSSDDEGTDTHEKDKDDDEGDGGDESDDGEEDDAEDKDDEEKDDDDVDQEIAKTDEQDDTERGGDDNEESESDEESDDEETRDEERFDPIPRTPEESEDDGNDEEEHGLKTGEEERLTKEEEADELYRDVDINQGMGIQVSQETKDSHVTLTPVNPDGVESIFATPSTSMASIPPPKPTVTPSIIATTTKSSQAPIPPTTFPSEILQHLPIRVAVQLQTNQLCDASQRENDEFLRTVDENMKKIIKEQVKSQVKDQVSRILPRIKQDGAEENSYQKMEGNKSIQRSDKQRNLYKALVEAYEADKIILDTYGDRVILKRRRDDEDDQGEGPSAGSDWGSKRQREGKEPESASAPLEPTTRSAGRLPLRLKNPHIRCLKQVNLEVQQYPHNLLLPLPLIPDNWGRRVIPFEHFINNDLEYLRGATCERSSTGSRKLLEEAQPYQARHDKKNRLMRIDELHKFSDGTLNDVRTALDDHLKGIRIQYLPHTIWRKGDKDKAAAMIQAIDKMLKTRTIMRSLEKFVGGWLYEGDFRMLQWTI
nr:hypothetical protein [Tanacetum cinerariifolium]